MAKSLRSPGVLPVRRLQRPVPAALKLRPLTALTRDTFYVALNMVTLLIFSVGLVTLIVAAALLWRFPVQMGASVVVLVGVVDCLQVWTSGITLGIFLYPNDIACAFLLGAAAVVTIRNGGISREFCWGALMLLGLTVLDFIRGTLEFGVKPAGNQARNIAYLLVPIVAFTSMQAGKRLRPAHIVVLLSGLSWVFIAIAILRWMAVLPTPEEIVDSDAIRDVIRVVPADGAMIIGQALIAVLGIQLIRGVRTAGVLTASCFVSVLFALQHRSVWMATSAGIAWLIIRSWHYSGPQWKRLAAIALVGLTAASAFLIATGQSAKIVSLAKSNIDETRRDDSTWEWRVGGFSEAIERSFSSGVIAAAFGPPAGRDSDDTADEASVHIHNRYIYILAYYGVTGLAIFGIWIWRFGARLRRFRHISMDQSRSLVEPAVLEAMLISELTYFIAYTGGLLHGAILAALWLATGTARDEKYQEGIIRTTGQQTLLRTLAE